MIRYEDCHISHTTRTLTLQNKIISIITGIKLSVYRYLMMKYNAFTPTDNSFSYYSHPYRKQLNFHIKIREINVLIQEPDVTGYTIQ
jgi:hypothetical protein